MEILLRAFGFTAHFQVGREETEDQIVEAESETEIADTHSGGTMGFARP